MDYEILIKSKDGIHSFGKWKNIHYEWNRDISRLPSIKTGRLKLKVVKNSERLCIKANNEKS